MQTEYVTHRQWDSCSRRIEKKNLREMGRSLTFTGISRRANNYIVEIQTDGMIVRPEWREAMKKESIND